MKFSSILLAACTILTSLAAPQGTTKSRPFHLKCSSDTFPPTDGKYLRMNKDGLGVLSVSDSELIVQAYRPDDGTRTLFVNGLDGTQDNAFLIPTEPGSLVSKLAFGDFAIPESRWTQWGIIEGNLTYGDTPDRFWVFPGQTEGVWEVLWVDEGAIVTADGFPINLVAEFL